MERRRAEGKSKRQRSWPKARAEAERAAAVDGGCPGTSFSTPPALAQGDPWAPEPVSISLNNASSLCGKLNYSAVIGCEMGAREGTQSEPA